MVDSPCHLFTSMHTGVLPPASSRGPMLSKRRQYGIVVNATAQAGRGISAAACSKTAVESCCNGVRAGKLALTWRRAARGKIASWADVAERSQCGPWGAESFHSLRVVKASRYRTNRHRYSLKSIKRYKLLGRQRQFRIITAGFTVAAFYVYCFACTAQVSRFRGGFSRFVPLTPPAYCRRHPAAVKNRKTPDCK